MTTVQMTPPKPVQRWQADDYAVKGRFVSELARPVLDLLAPKKGERIELLRPALCDADGTWTADHIRLRFAAERLARGKACCPRHTDARFMEEALAYQGAPA